MNPLKRLRHPMAIAAGAFALLGTLSLLPATKVTDGSLPLARLALALIGILALAQAMIPLLRRMPGRGKGENRRLRCEEILALDSRHRLALVRVDGQELLLSLQADGSTLLSELKKPCATPDSQEPTQSEGEHFARLLARRRGS